MSRHRPRLRVQVQTFEGDPPFDLHVEPWGETVRIANGAPAIVTFLGPADHADPPAISVSACPEQVVICAEGGVEDYLIEDPSGQPFTAR
jgi:hypothetical protein